MIHTDSYSTFKIIQAISGRLPVFFVTHLAPQNTRPCPKEKSPKAEAKAEAKAQPKAEPKAAPKAEPKAPAMANGDDLPAQIEALGHSEREKVSDVSEVLTCYDIYYI